MKILLVTDGSSEARNALSFSSQFVRRVAEPPTILTVIAESSDRSSSQAHDILVQAQELVGVPNSLTQVRIGELLEKILHEANEGDFDLVILGDKRPQNLLTQIFWDSIAIRVAESAPCSVIIVRGIPSNIHRILLCDSGAGLSSLLNRLVVLLTDLLDGEEDVTVLHVMSQMSAGPGVRGSQLRADAQELVEEHTPEGELLESDIQMLEQPGIHPSPKVRHGLVVDEILAEASSGDYDLVVVGAHSESGPQSFLLDNIAHQILKRINRPILVVREKGVLNPIH
jgi:nucleotide-binding universal stress UspA family protein